MPTGRDLQLGSCRQAASGRAVGSTTGTPDCCQPNKRRGAAQNGRLRACPLHRDMKDGGNGMPDTGRDCLRPSRQGQRAGQAPGGW